MRHCYTAEHVSMHYKLLVWLSHARFVLAPQLGPGGIELPEPRIRVSCPYSHLQNAYCSRVYFLALFPVGLNL